MIVKGMVPSLVSVYSIFKTPLGALAPTCNFFKMGIFTGYVFYSDGFMLIYINEIK